MTIATNGKNAAEKSTSGKKTAGREEGLRETIEAVVIAFILAFIFKTFEGEAFVIPTGSMAPTLYGRHKEVTCTGCGLDYTIGASQEIDQESGQLLANNRISQSTCPNCRRENDVLNAPVFNGDRIVVNKQVAKYDRYDVVVFKNPEEPHVNYIKRLVGLPGETIRIRQGDIYARRSGTDPWMIQRKDSLTKQREIQLLVYDDRFPPTKLLKAGAEERWVPSEYRPEEKDIAGWPIVKNAWQPSAENRSYTVDTQPGGLQWLRYRHLIPSWEHWDAANDGDDIETPLLPQLVTDFCGFNSDNRPGNDQELFWTNDLTIEFALEISEIRENSEFVIELEEGVRTVQCRIHPSTGDVQLCALLPQKDGTEPQKTVIAAGTSSIQGPGSYDIAFANVDDRLTLWVDGSAVDLQQQGELVTEGLNLPTDRDLAPVGIAASGLKATVSELLLRRDIYYRNDLIVTDADYSMTANPYSRRYGDEYHSIMVNEAGRQNYSDLRSILRSPAAYAGRYSSYQEQLDRDYGTRLELKLNDDEYLMLGDNSPASKDGRLFDYYSRPMRGIQSHRYAVRESDLIGEALCIFWPHGIPFLNNGRGYTVLSHKGDSNYPMYTFPFVPNVSRMKLIR